MRRRLLAVAVLLSAVAAIALGGSSNAATVRVGNLVLHADGGFEPRLLPKRAFAPIHFQGYGEIKTTDGSMPPALEHVRIEFDHDGRIAGAGLAVCHPGQIEGLAPATARRRCAGAIVGRGHVSAKVDLAIARIGIGSPLTLFNGPRLNGNPTVIGHAQAPFPVSETYVVVVPIERRRGTFGYRASFDIPPIAGGLGSLTRIDAKIGRRYTAGGRRRSYVSARCSDYVLQTQGYFSFSDGNVIYGSVFKACRPRD